MEYKEPNIDPKLLSPYDPTSTEDRIYALWQESGFFNPDICIEKGVTAPDAKPFSIVLPPPNVTGTLHIGHAAMLVIEDIMVRFARMQGYRTLWLPGTDHAAIATQSKVEKIIEKEGLRKNDMGREEFLKRVTLFAQDSHDAIVSQIKKMGASIDWSREAFTLDEKRNVAVRTAFKKMYDDGLIYRGHRIVNWDPKGQTVISDDEIVYKEEKTKFYYLKYGPFTIGTARPETKFGDKYVVMHPDDTRYMQYKHGDTIEVEWINGPISATIIKDESIDMEFGTGVMTITPWHSAVDFGIAERHKLDKEQIIDTYGKLLSIAGEFAGMKIKDARAKIIEKLESKGLVEKIEDYTHNIATAERTEAVIEPQIMNQWFINVNKPIADRENKSLKELMLEPVKNGNISILPDRFERVYYNWVENLRDWCISRQIWYGHRIPVWYKGEEIYCGIEAPREEGWEQDSDTLDTWFSSGLWTFSTLGWPEKTKDFETYHPTTILETGYDIIFFWVARMILMSQYLLGDIPFKTVYLHGLVRDAQGRKMSKSLGNIIDPLDVAKKYGADAVRMSLIIGTGPGNDSKMSEDKIKAYKNFANKLWNITRFILSSTEGIIPDAKFSAYTDADKALIVERDEIMKAITKEMEEYKFYLAGDKIYQYAWARLADVIIEESKPILGGEDDYAKNSRAQFLLDTLAKVITALHPFMPFVTEELWSLIPRKDKNLLLVTAWPASHS
ncbi:MAG: valine--tRNA ligase [Patescibacteria group bacterium]